MHKADVKSQILPLPAIYGPPTTITIEMVLGHRTESLMVNGCAMLYVGMSGVEENGEAVV